MVGIVLGVLFGLAIGIGLAFLVTISLVKKSNDMGDSFSTIDDVSEEGLSVWKFEDGIRNTI